MDGTKNGKFGDVFSIFRVFAMFVMIYIRATLSLPKDAYGVKNFKKGDIVNKNSINAYLNLNMLFE